MADPPKDNLLLDPFANVPDADVYVPRDATDLSLRMLLESVRSSGKCTALIGPSGLGKSLLLQTLAARVRDEWETVYLSHAALPPQELGAWALRLLGSPSADDPAAALRAFGKHLLEEQSALLIMIDDAGALPDDTARWVGRLITGSHGALRLLIAASDDTAGGQAIAAIGASFNSVFLTQPMSVRETAH